MSNLAIQFDHVGKLYRLGQVGTGTLSHDLNRWWVTKILHKEDPYLKIGETNDRSKKGKSDYVWALRDITFDVNQGDVIGIIGRNGAGKSTLLKLLSQITSPTIGAIRAKGRIGSLLEVGTGFHPEMTGRENIYMNGSIMGMTRHEISRKLDEIVDFAGIERYLDTPVKRFSSGMTVRLGFAVAAFMEPEILVVDEVLAVGDAEFQKKAIGKMQDISKGEGRTVLFVSHNMDSMLNLCHRGILLENGIVIYENDIKSTVKKYLGEGKKDYYYTLPEDRAKGNLFLASARFIGNEQQEKGLFSFSDNIQIELIIKKKGNSYIDKNATLSVIIMTANQLRICSTDIPLNIIESEKKFELNYQSEILLPNNYFIQIVLHVPNVQFYDKQDVCWFSIYDNGTHLLKYNRANNGIIMLNPSIIEK